MKKIVAILTALFMCLTCVNVMAAEATPDELNDKNEYAIGNIGDYTLMYKAPESWLDYEKTVSVANFCLTMKCDEVPIYLVKGNDEYQLCDDIVNNIISEYDLPTIESYFNGCELEPFKERWITFWQCYDIEPEATPDQPGCSDGPTPGGLPETDPSEPCTEAPVQNPTYDPVIPIKTRPATTAPAEDHIVQPATKKPYPDATEAPEVTVAPTEKAPPKPSGKDVKIHENSATASSAIPSLNIRTATLKCGKRFDINVRNKGKKKVKFSSSAKKIAAVNKNGVVTTLRKGRAKIIVKVGKRKLRCIVKVTSNPKLAPNSVTVKKGKTVSVKIIGKAKGVNNKYKNTEYANIVSKKTANTITVKGRKRGKTTVKVVVNKLALKLKVKVK